MFSAWMRRQSARYCTHDPASLAQHQVAIVPGARVYASGVPCRPLRQRLQAAATLWASKTVQSILVSGHGSASEYDEVAAMAKWLRGAGVPETALSCDPYGLRTLDTMERAARLLGVRDAVVCTQAFHLPRAILLARNAGINAIGLAVDPPQDGSSLGDRLREQAACARAYLDAYGWATQPKHLLP